MSEAEHPDRLRPGREVTVDDVRQLMGASTPHFALQLRARIRALIRDLPREHPARMRSRDCARSPRSQACRKTNSRKLRFNRVDRVGYERFISVIGLGRVGL